MTNCGSKHDSAWCFRESLYKTLADTKFHQIIISVSLNSYDSNFRKKAN